jgi:hypothetical protein
MFSRSKGSSPVKCADRTKRWYVDDKLHRLDGPAIEYTN